VSWLVVNADDGGFAPGKDDAILRCARAGAVRSVSVIANGATTVAFVERARDAGLDLGVHLNLTEGRPLGGPQRSLTDAHGRFPGKAEAWRRASVGDLDPDELRRELTAQWERFDEPFRRVKKQLEEYFDGSRHRFDLDLAPEATPFQSRVLDALQEIPYGETRSYREVAEVVGNPKAVRAVGGANGNNPIPIVIPCHRVIGSNGTLTGFGGGLDSKRFLLDLERSHSGLFGN